jgi:hypothetical protein
MRKEKLLQELKIKGDQMKNKPVLVTTEFRGVFFGYLKDDKNLPDEITITKVRNCIYWDSSIGGFLGLASEGPNDKCKIGVEVPELRLFKVTSVSPVSEEAEKKWHV